MINNHQGDLQKVLLLQHILYLLLKKIFFVGATLHIDFLQISFQTTKVVTGDVGSCCNFDS